MNEEQLNQKTLDTTDIFENFNEALSFVLKKEQESLANDISRQVPPFIIHPHDSSRPPLKLFPGVAFWNSANEKDFILTRLQSGRYSLKPNLRSRKFLFRGQTEFYDNCSPSLFREQKNRFTADLVYGQEMQLLQLSHPMVRLLDCRINLLGYNFTFEMNLYGLTQHYYNKTSFMDLTSDADIAGFFATNKYNPTSDTYTPITDNSKEGVLYYYYIDSDEAFIRHRLSTIGLQVFPRSGQQRGFLQKISKDKNFNNHPLVKWVKFKHNADVSEYYNKKFDSGVKLFPTDILELHWKNRKPNTISNRTFHFNLFINNYKDSLPLVIKELNEAGIHIECYPISFSDDELHEYYQDIKNGFWEEWCNKIYFNGDKDNKFKNALISIVNNPDYAWAFEEGKAGNMPKNGYLSSIYTNYII